ncbi:MAG: substrate-binding domain-containing protein [Anaplasmataceae bacterium]|nr:substrate-binding domain-containing protein [Anaplasmataceae bacterium]
MTNRNYYISLYIFSLFISCSLPALGRDYIHIVGSSTVFPFISFVAEEFSKVNRVTTPVVESIGTGVGMKMLCDINTNNSVDRPDIVMSSRRITDSEIYLCQNYGVKNFLEIKIGYDGLVIASVTDTPILNFSFLDLFKILSAVIPDENGKLINNKFHKWSDIMTELSDDKIEIYGPARSSGSYNTLINKILLPICLSNFISYDIIF